MPFKLAFSNMNRQLKFKRLHSILKLIVGIFVRFDSCLESFNLSGSGRCAAKLVSDKVDIGVLKVQLELGYSLS
jgi:hypothetical protein